MEKAAEAAFYFLQYSHAMLDCKFDYIPYFLRNLSTRPAVSRIICLPV